MKLQFIHKTNVSRAALFFLSICLVCGVQAQTDSTTAQSSAAAEAPAVIKPKPVKNTFNSVWIIDNQTVMVPVKKTFEMDIMHRFGTVGKGYENFWGLFAPSNIRLGFNYSPLNKLYVGFGITKDNMLWDFNAKYAIIKQTNGLYPVSVTYYTNAAYDSRKDPDNSLFRTEALKEKGDFLAKRLGASPDRFKFFHQLIIARKITEKLSIQVAPSVTHQNAVNGYYKYVDSATKVVAGQMKHDHFAIAFSGRYKLTTVTNIIVNYDQPLTKHVVNNPAPNISLGFEFTTSNHAFQVFMGNYSYLNPARNNLENQNSMWTGKAFHSPITIKQFLIGFNVTRLWNY
ncbi:DUF5777 family beta-barrel protein [Flavisolibacter ginsenosidimutans]|uniref:DUF5777 domain-containing protein n=1 Tax=Flavisolibacter ginsenosidimutans TaxID=661481 RepID=A0A5B8UGA6_9BACT|nr:DUF5777 family beta-barrel protein [Flavisolibacter ginsenosidimutans]QEC55538.1 hypothetical protein FSB75_06355 [Flavisolibacter ginsenosidimutans]